MAFTKLKSLNAEIKQLEAQKKLVEKRDGEGVHPRFHGHLRRSPGHNHRRYTHACARTAPAKGASCPSPFRWSTGPNDGFFDTHLKA